MMTRLNKLFAICLADLRERRPPMSMAFVEQYGVTYGEFEALCDMLLGGAARIVDDGDWADPGPRPMRLSLAV